MTSAAGTRARFLIGFLLIWAALYLAGVAQDGDVTFGLLALAATVAVAAAWEAIAFGTPPRQLLTALGLGRPTGRSLVAGAVAAGLVVAFYPVYALVSGSELPLRADWLWLAVGLFAYHGLAEELVWRGYVFRRLREGRSFARAVLWSVPLIALTHIPIVAGNGLAVGLFAVVVAAVTCLPFAYLWERGGQTIWAAAMLHAAIDVFKLVEVPPGEAVFGFSISLAIVSLFVPLIVFVFGDRFFGGPLAPARGPDLESRP